MGHSGSMQNYYYMSCTYCNSKVVLAYLICNADGDLWYFDIDEGFDVSGPLLEYKYRINTYILNFNES